MIGLKKKKKEPIQFVRVEYSTEAKNLGVGYSFLKKIYHIYRGYVIEIEDFTEPKIQELKRDGIYVIDKTEGIGVPEETRFVPDSLLALQRLQVTKLIGHYR